MATGREKMKTEEYCTKLDRLLSGQPSPETRLQEGALSVARFFSVTTDEIAIFRLDEGEGILRFCWPDKLSQMGFIPLCARDSLAVRTVKENRASTCNSFAAVRHASAFEEIRLNPAQKEKLPIQKILSAPLPCAGKPVGVIQVSRKATQPAAVADFTPADMAALEEIAKVLARHLSA